MNRASIQGMLAEVEKTIAALRRNGPGLGFAQEQLALYEALNGRMQAARAAVDAATAGWRTAARSRTRGPEEEAAALYGQVKLQLEAHFDDPQSPQLVEFLHTSPNPPNTAAEWLEDLEKLQRGLTDNQDTLGFALERLPQLEAAVAGLRGAMDEVAARLADKKAAQAEWEAAKAAYRLARATLRRKLEAHFGKRNDPRLKEFLD